MGFISDNVYKTFTEHIGCLNIKRNPTISNKYSNLPKFPAINSALCYQWIKSSFYLLVSIVVRSPR